MTNYFRTTVLLAVMIALFMVIGQWMGGTRGMFLALVISSILSFGSLWFSDKVVLAMYHARQVDEASAPELYHMVNRLALRAGLPMPKVYIVPNATPNAFATGRSPRHAAVAVTEGIMNLLDANELEGVLAHELAHIRNRDMLISTLAAVMAGAIMFLARMAFWFGPRDDGEGNMLGSLLMLILAPIGAMLIQMAVSRSREYGADATGASIAGNPGGLASALAKLGRISGRVRQSEQPEPATAHMMIVNHFSGKSMMGLFSTHPPIEERIIRLKQMNVGGVA